MGDLRNRRIVQSRIWLDETYAQPLPVYDYDYTYPITVYDAVRKTTEDNSTTLSDELAAIYRLIAEKQPIIGAGEPGQIMTWSGVAGEIGSLNVTKTIAALAADRSNNKIPTERAVGIALDNKTPILDFNLHRDNNDIHVTTTERNRWNNMAPMSSLSSHIANQVMHITAAERTRWNAKADASDLDEHIYNVSNPHSVTAHQVNSYTMREVDEMIQGIHESFFNYVNIEYNSQTDEAELVEYDALNWNPNYVLDFDSELPDVSDAANTYFALRPATDYSTEESQSCVIYIKTPGVAWREVGTADMKIGDMVIAYPSTVMYVWVSGRFVSLFSGSNGSSGDGSLWYPSVASDGTLTWSLSYSASQPTPVNIKGEDGYTPVKGVDYFDGVNGVGIPAGGDLNELIVKLSTDNYNTAWKSLTDVIGDWALAGNVLPDNVVVWSGILNRPEWYQEFGQNEDGFISQKVITNRFLALEDDLAEMSGDIADFKNAKDEFYAHILDWDNPHHTTPAKIGAVSLGDFTAHTSDFNNPHAVTKAQVGLGNADNTSDLDKPISTAVQTVIDAIYNAINGLDTNFASANFIKNITWDNNTLSLVLTFRDNTELSLPIPIANLQVRFDSSTNELVFTQPDTSEVRVDVSSLIPVYSGSDSDNIHVVIENDNTIKATIIPGTVGQYEIAPSVNLRNSPTTTTQVVSDRSTKIATTEFVASQTINNLISYDIDRPLSANMGRILNQEKVDVDTVQQMINDISIADVIDNLDSTNQTAALSANMGRYLNLTKAPRVHTSPNGATFGIATISLFGHTRASEVDPEMDGTVFRGTDDGRYARADHRHPTDITRLSVTDFNAHADTGIPSETGAHNLRFYNNSLDYKDTNGNWISVFGYLRSPNTAYQVGDVIQDLTLPKWAELECELAGTTGSGALTVPSTTIGSYTGVCIGDHIVDGTVKWVVRAKRTQLMLGVPTPFVGNFATVTSGSSSYKVPLHNNLGIPMLDCRFCDGSNGTIDMRNRFIMGKNAISDNDGAGGADTVTLTQNQLPKIEYTIDMSGLSSSSDSKSDSIATFNISDGAHSNHFTSYDGTNYGRIDLRLETDTPSALANAAAGEYLAFNGHRMHYFPSSGAVDAATLKGGRMIMSKGSPSNENSLESLIVAYNQLSGLPTNPLGNPLLWGNNYIGWASWGVVNMYSYNNDPADLAIGLHPGEIIGGSHTHTIPAQTTAGHNHTITLSGKTPKIVTKLSGSTLNTDTNGLLKLNHNSSQSSFSVVSKHYKLAYIQRIY